jgi:dienelactone hydrolase
MVISFSFIQNKFQMKQLNTLLLLLITMLGTIGLSAQTGRYRTNVFTSWTVQKDVVYANNISVLTGTPAAQNLVMDVYTPAGDNAKNRAAVVYFHTGSFLPPIINGGITGARSDSSVVEFARRLTRLGYVVFVPTYRLGWNPAATGPGGQNTRTGTLLNAAYRGVQDARSCVRFLRKTVAADNNPYGIDPNRLVLWGQGTGGYISMGAAYLDRFKEEIQIPKFIDTDKLTAYVDTNLSSNPLGTTAKPLNLANNPSYSSDFQLAVNMGGALGDASWLEGKAGEPAVIGFHVLSDPFAPFADGAVIVPTTREFVVNVSGTRSILQRANTLNLNAKLAPANAEQVFVNLKNQVLKNVPLPNGPNTNIGGMATTLSADNMYPFVTPGNRFEAGPWEWWDTTTLKLVVAGFNAATGRKDDWKVLHSNGLLTNPNMSKAKAMAYIDTMMQVFIPRAFLQLNLATSTEQIISEDVVKLKIGPNPVADRVYLQTALEHKMRDIALYSLDGKMVRGYANVDENDFELIRGSIPAGTYVLQVRFDKGLLAKQLVLK